MAGPFTSDVHVPRPLTDAERKTARDEIEKRGRAPLYVYRAVENAAEIIAWAKAQGFKTTLPADDLHVTITFSRMPVDWLEMGQPWANLDSDGKLKIAPGGPRAIEAFGPEGKAVVLAFASWDLEYRNREMREKGASWDWAEFTPHITLTYDGEDLDLDKIKPYAGKIILGPEIFEPIDEDWSSNIVEKREVFATIAKVDEELGLVFGWAIVCKINGVDYFDLNVDPDGTRVPEHVTEKAMLKAATRFMKSERLGNEMHAGPDSGHYVFAFPLTTDIAKEMGIKTQKTGLMIAYEPTPDVLAKYKSGEYRGFSIEGSRVKAEEVA